MHTTITVSLIAALDQNDLIGAAGGMPWHIPADLKYFKKMTLNKPILMGRKTFESIGKALPQRQNLVLTSQTGFSAEGCERVASLGEAIKIAEHSDAQELMVIGGSQVFEQAMPFATQLYITRIQQSYEGDTWFPEINWHNWRLASQQNQSAANLPTVSYELWTR